MAKPTQLTDGGDAVPMITRIADAAFVYPDGWLDVKIKGVH